MKQSSHFGSALGTMLGVTLLAQSVSLPAFAALGGDASSVEADRVKLKGQVHSATPGSGYSVHEMQLPSGTTVREYVSADNKVFAVTWSGPTMPDLQQTLGTYYEQFKAAAASGPRGSHHHLTVRQPDLVVQSGGHMRAHFGKAYVPSLLPQNVSVDDIK